MVEKIGCRPYLEKKAKDKKIVIYGALASGQVIYKELLERQWGEVVAVVDRAAGDLILDKEFHCPLMKPEKLFDGLKWDYVYLGTSSPNAKREIKKYLMENGTKEEQILYYGEESFFDGKNEYRMFDDPEKAVFQIVQANENLKGEYDLTLQFQEWMERYYDSLTDQDAYIRKVGEDFAEHPSLEIRIVMGLYLYHFKILEAGEMKKLVDYVSQLPDEQREWLYFLCHKIAYMELYQNKVLYKGLGPDRKALWKRVADQYCQDKKAELESAKRKEGHIAILVPLLTHPHISSVDMIYYTMANALCDQGKEVKVFVIPYAQKKSFGFLSVADGIFCDRTKQYMQANREVFDHRVKIEFIEEQEISSMLGTAVDKIMAFEPSCIIDITDQLCPVSCILYKYYPILYYAVRQCTMGTYFEKTTVGVFDYNEEVSLQKVTVPYLYINKKEMYNYNRSERLDVPENSFVVVTVGERLSSEVDPPLVEKMATLLKEKERMYWVLVGDDAVSKNLAGLDEQVHKKIRIYTYEEDLAALYKLCDVFVNPDRAGGGFSMMFAMQQGVAMAALKKDLYGDVKRIGEDELIDGGYKELCEYVGRLYDCPELLTEKKEKMRKISREKADIKPWVTALCSALDETERSFMEGD